MFGGEQGGYTRVGGTALGGASFLGLARALTSATTYREALALAARGDSSEVDTLVEDIYGSTGCVDLGLPPSLTAASFGKLARQGNRSARDEDVCRALLEMVAQSCCARGTRRSGGARSASSSPAVF